MQLLVRGPWELLVQGRKKLVGIGATVLLVQEWQELQKTVLLVQERQELQKTKATELPKRRGPAR